MLSRFTSAKTDVQTILFVVYRLICPGSSIKLVHNELVWWFICDVFCSLVVVSCGGMH